jgi:hypothetical protein
MRPTRDPSRCTTALRLAAPLAAALLSAAPVRAQDAPAPVAARGAPPAAPGDYRTTVGGSPFLPIAGIFTGEVETALAAAGVTLGAGGIADFSGSEERYNSLQAKLKYYPNEQALRGFALGLTFGMASISERVTVCVAGDLTGCIEQRARTRRDTKPTFGVVADYNWLIGRQRRFLVGAGVGARRVLGDVGGDSPLVSTLPDGRLVVGWAF